MIPDWLEPRVGTARMMYLIHPHLMKELGDVFEDLARARGYEPFNPFAFERGRDGKFKKANVEESLVGRPAMLNFGLKMQTGTGASSVMGISEGCMGELRDRLNWDTDKNIHVWRYSETGDSFDSGWDEKYEKFRKLPEYGDVLADLRNSFHWLLPFVGPSAIGKTYWFEQLREHFGQSLMPVKNVTTRAPRDKRDASYYYRVSREDFELGKRHGAFWEYDDYVDACYGSSIEEARRVLKTSSGVFALTPEGAKKWYERRFDFNMRLVVLKPVSEDVLIRNFQRRNELDPQRVAEKLKKAKHFVLPSEIEHTVVPITGDDEYDRPRIFDAVRPFIK